MTSIFNFILPPRNVIIPSSLVKEKASKIFCETMTITKQKSRVSRKIKKTHPKKDRGGSDVEMYDYRNSLVDQETLDDFIKSPLSKCMDSVPGMSPVSTRVLMNEGVETPHQLMSVYLAMNGATECPVEVTDMFYLWLRTIGITSNRDTIARVVALKVNSWVPGIYNEEAYYIAH